MSEKYWEYLLMVLFEIFSTPLIKKLRSEPIFSKNLIQIHLIIQELLESLGHSKSVFILLRLEFYSDIDY